MARLRFPVEAGVMIRGQVKREIRKAAFSYGLECQVEEDKGLFESVYYFTVTGDDDTVLAFQRAVAEWARQNG